ncbi:MAG: thiamine-phosphate synthase family protein [Thermoplasmata archaeon]
MEKTTTVLCISSLDTSGISGITADVNAISFLGLHPLPVIVNYAIETQEFVVDVIPVASRVIENSIKHALTENPSAIKLGMIGRKEIGEIVSSMLPPQIPIVADPVFVATSGQYFAEDAYVETFMRSIAPRATLITPNVPEAEILLGAKIKTPDDAKIASFELHKKLGCNVLLKGGHIDATDYLVSKGEIHVFPGELVALPFRGTGCILSSLIAGFLAQHLDLVAAVKKSKYLLADCLNTPQFLGKKYRVNPFWSARRNLEKWNTYITLVENLPEFLKTLKNDYIPEVGTNIGFALPDASSKNDVCAIDGRIVRSTEGPKVIEKVKFGAGDHIPRIILTVMKFDPEKRSAMNLRYAPETVEKAKRLGFVVGTFSRKEEKENVKDSTMEWGTELAIRSVGTVPDMIYDLGDVGKEPMIRLIAADPPELLKKLKKLVI